MAKPVGTSSSNTTLVTISWEESVSKYKLIKGQTIQISGEDVTQQKVELVMGPLVKFLNSYHGNSDSWDRAYAELTGLHRDLSVFVTYPD